MQLPTQERLPGGGMKGGRTMTERDVRLLMEIGPERASLVGLIRGVELQRTKTTKAGKLLWCESYPIWSTETRTVADARLAAERGKRGTTEAQKRLNARKAEERLVQLVNANFKPGDYFLTATYQAKDQPGDLDEANRRMRNYIARLRRLCSRKGIPSPTYVYVTETVQRKRGVEYHHHMVLQAGLTREECESCWEKSGNGHMNSRIIKPQKEGLIGLAKYMGKQVCSYASSEGYINRHRWCASKGLITPEPRGSDKRISRRRVERIAEAMQRDTVEAQAHLERCYPGYEVLEMSVRTNKWVTGAYVRAVMVRRE